MVVSRSFLKTVAVLGLLPIIILIWSAYSNTLQVESNDDTTMQEHNAENNGVTMEEHNAKNNGITMEEHNAENNGVTLVEQW